ncbi:MAG: YfhO family protein, partial [Ekhidna sp.]|nr:YfhO family protein [Ekhidna sp.]
LNQSASGERILNLLNPFNDATPSYHHESIGGYHGAKLGRYQELIEYHLSPEIQELTSRIREGNREMQDFGVLNMLNTKFIKFGDTPQQVIQNSSINGNAWFVQAIKKVNSADEEINALGSIDTKETAVIDVSKFGEISDFDPNNSYSSIELTARDLNEISYQYTSESGGLIVFSEIYYPKGWIATIDGQETDILRANYVLRALLVPTGKHEIKFEFKPRIYTLGNRVSLVFGVLLYGSVLLLSAQPLLAKKVNTQQPF